MVKFILPLFALAFLLVSCGKQSDTAPVPPVSVVNSASMQKLEQAKKGYDGKLLAGKVNVVLHTTKGDVSIELDADVAPKTVTNFVTLAKAGFYDGLLFHRVIPNFMIQGGDPKGDGTGGQSLFGPTFEDEINASSYGLDKKSVKDVAQGQQIPPELANLTVKQLYEQQGYKYNSSLKSLPLARGAIAMANRGPNTNGSQFFIVQTKEAPWLEGRHTVFGKVTAGMDVVDAIAAADRDVQDRPTTAITMTVEVK